YLTVYALDSTGKVFKSTDGGQIAWTEITGNLALPQADAIEYIKSTTNANVLLVGGRGGVYHAINPTDNKSIWTEYGGKLPNVLVRDLEYNKTDNVLVAGTFGRGAWKIPVASSTVGVQPVLKIDGTAGNDTIKIERNALNPSIVDVYLNSASPVLSA